MTKHLKIKIKKIIQAFVICVPFLYAQLVSAEPISVAEAFYGLAKNGKINEITQLLQRGYSMESLDGRGYNAVCLSVARKNKNAYETLVAQGAKPKPDCLKKIPESAYRRFFGEYSQNKVPAYTSDTPYLVGATVLGAGAIATAFLVGGGSGGSNNNGGGDDGNDCPNNSTYNQSTGECDCNAGYGHYEDNTTCYATIPNCASQSEDICTACISGYTLKDNVCYIKILNCKEQDGDICSECNEGFDLYGGDGKTCYATIPNCASQNKNTCSSCVSNYSLKDNVCYAPILNCKTQDGDICSECNEGFDLYGGDGKTCYATVSNCANQSKDICTACISGYTLKDKDNVCTPDCPNNSTYNQSTGKCDCNEGYNHYGDDTTCYATVSNCANQSRDICTACISGYTIKDNVCYIKILNCKEQDGDICSECNEGFDLYGGDGKTCYATILNCQTQQEDKCLTCNTGYDTYGDPSANYCYEDNLCKDYDNTVPVNQGADCQCNAEKGYTGDKTNCVRTEDGEYQEGDGSVEVWDDYNERYCNSHGKYLGDGRCQCYTEQGYSGNNEKCNEEGSACCSSCITPGYIDVEGICYKDLQCDAAKHFKQDRSECVCDDGYIEDQTTSVPTCIKQLSCELHYEQQGEECACKSNFDATCTQCIDGYNYDPVSDTCMPVKCEEQWQGENCSFCPAQYKITTDENNEAHCGLECAENRVATVNEKGELLNCDTCADGYVEDGSECVITDCSAGKEGYKQVGNKCECDTENGYVRDISGMCVKKSEKSIIGVENRNINNTETVVSYEGGDGTIADVYGMKPVIMSDSGEESYYSSVYNAFAANTTQTATLNITNKNTGNNTVYGIYSDSNIYNAAVFNTGKNSVSATADIKITDTNTMSNIYGIYNAGTSNTYNSFAYASGENSSSAPSEGTSVATISISKDEKREDNFSDGGGKIVGIESSGEIYNSYATTQSEDKQNPDNVSVGANVYATGNLKIINEGEGDVYGINGTSGKRVINSYAYLDSAVSDAVSTGNINVEGKNNVYGIYSQGSVINSATQFNRSFVDIKDFRSIGNITALGSGRDAVYGIALNRDTTDKQDVYNAMGYNSTGNITVSNEGGGSAYGISSAGYTYVDTDGNIKYDTVYNAFRSSAKYGGENVAAIGNINVSISGDGSNQQGVGIKSNGNVYNAYAKSAGDVKLEATGSITVEDQSGNETVELHGIEAGGNVIANAYSEWAKHTDDDGKNISTTVNGTININSKSRKNGSSAKAIGIYNPYKNTQIGSIYNAALVNDLNNVTGTIAVTADYGISRMYGIYASNDFDIEGNSVEEGQRKTVYNAYYNNIDETLSEGSVKGEIKIIAQRETSDTDPEYYGIYVKDGDAYNVWTSNSDADVTGTIDINVVGGVSRGIAAGMYGENARLDNSGTNATINVKTSGKSAAYGMYGINSTLYNSGEINVTAEKSVAYGMRVDQGAAINKGTINVTGNRENYGIYATSGETEAQSVAVTNTGTININGSGKNTGIYASGAYASVINTGTININGEENTTICEGEECGGNNAIVLKNKAKLYNDGEVTTTGSLNFDDMGGEVILSENGKFEAAEDIRGNLSVSSAVVLQNFDEDVVLENALTAKSIDDLNLNSKSYLYTVAALASGKETNDVILTKKAFSEVTDANKAAYLENNYTAKKNNTLFNTLKSAETAAEYSKTEAATLGTSVLPNMTEENLKVMRSLDKKMVDELFTEGGEIRKMVGGDALYVGRDDHGNLSGYDLYSQSIYSLYDKKINNHYRLGAGLSLTHSSTDYNNDSSRKNFMIQGYVPLTYNFGNGLTAVSMAQLGYSNGEYKRRGYNHTYEADTSDINYGLQNEIRYRTSALGVNITPFAGLNILGWYQNSVKEDGDDLALRLDSANVFSLEGALGLYVDKDIEFDTDNKLNIALGVGYYHEFADPYRGIDAQVRDTIGKYKVRENIASRDRGAISAKVNYDYKAFSLYGELMQYLEKEYPLKVDVGVKYNF